MDQQPDQTLTDVQAAGLERKITRLEAALADERERRLRSSGTARLLGLTLLFLGLEGLVIYYVDLLGEGKNVA